MVGQNGELAERLIDLQPFHIRLAIVPERAGEIYQACMQMTYLLQMIDVLSKNHIRDHRNLPYYLRTYDDWMQKVVQKNIDKGEPLTNLVGWEQHPDAKKFKQLYYGQLVLINGKVDLRYCTITLHLPGAASSVPPLADMVAMKGYWIKVQAVDHKDGTQNIQIDLAPSFHIKNNGEFFYANETMLPDEILANYSDLIAVFVEDMRWYIQDMPEGWKEWGAGLLVNPGYPKEKPYLVHLNECPTTAAHLLKNVLEAAPKYLRIR
jgi:hypothetical protein